jgi:hypothetical protein
VELEANVSERKMDEDVGLKVFVGLGLIGYDPNPALNFNFKSNSPNGTWVPASSKVRVDLRKKLRLLVPGAGKLCVFSHQYL